MKHNRFAKGSGVYTCRICKKQTRETGEGESAVRLCVDCWNEAGQENCHSDDGHDGDFKNCPICKRALGK